MQKDKVRQYKLDYIEIYSPMAKIMAYWHVQALGFRLTAVQDAEGGVAGMASYLVESGDVRLLLTSAYPAGNSPGWQEIDSFITQNYCGVKRVVLRTESVKGAFSEAIAGGGIPVRSPRETKDGFGAVEEAGIKLYDHNEIGFINRDSYSGVFKPGYRSRASGSTEPEGFLRTIDHIASEVRLNECYPWTGYLKNCLGLKLVQNIGRGEDNKTGMILNISQSSDQELTFVIAEPESPGMNSKVQKNIDNFGPGIHHIAFRTDGLVDTFHELKRRGVEFVDVPAGYYDLLREMGVSEEIDIDELERCGILLDKEGDSYLLQKFIRPISERPFFLYEIVERINGYQGFALKNINVLKKAEELQIMK